MKPTASTQENVPIAGVKDGIIILKDGQYRLVLEVTAINFSLKSEEEQNSLVLQYQGFLNSIHFPVQIVIRSKRLDLAPYINKIKDLANKQTNELLRIQTTDYVDFVGQLINLANIMKKTFYLVVGYQPLTVGQGTILDKLLNRNKPVDLRISDEEFVHNTKEMTQRGQNAAQGLGSMGLHCKQLTTEEVIELFYGIYNPEVAGKERLTEAENVSSSYISSSEKEEKPNQEVNLETKEQQPAIDNKALVLEQEKNKAKEREFENQSQEQRSIGMNEPEKKSPIQPAESETVDIKANRQTKIDQGPAAQTNTQTPNLAVNNNKPADKNTFVNNQPTIAVNPQPLDPTSGTERKAIADPKINKDYGW